MKNQNADAAGKLEKLFAPPDVHETERQTQGALITFAVATLLLEGETVLWYMVLCELMPVPPALLLHAGFVLLLAVYGWLSRRGGDQRFALLLLITTGVTGPFGAGGVMLTIATHAWSLQRRLSFQEWFASLFPKLALGPSQKIYEELYSGRDESGKSHSVVSFLDIMAFGNELQKRHALAKMAAHFYPGFAPALKKGLSDDSNMIRVQAATAIAKVESEFQTRTIKLSGLKKKHDDDPRLLWALAEIYDDYSHTGLIDPDREQANRRLALEHYRAYLRLAPDDDRTYARIGRLLMRAGDNEKACDWFRQCIDQGKASEALTDWYSEALFRCGRYDDLRRWSAGLPPGEQRATLQPALAEALALWKKET
ncbi:MAG: hypothetical protein KGI29_04125 [Pseudomonadota bacterium]|nr:hypothetical protein [Pseudomonadota bacterium]MDE3037278.1 hypothetical protein [Pseudomonadota bacterium]